MCVCVCVCVCACVRACVSVYGWVHVLCVCMYCSVTVPIQDGPVPFQLPMELSPLPPQVLLSFPLSSK